MFKDPNSARYILKNDNRHAFKPNGFLQFSCLIYNHTLSLV